MVNTQALERWLTYSTNTRVGKITLEQKGDNLHALRALSQKKKQYIYIGSGILR